MEYELFSGEFFRKCIMYRCLWLGYCMTAWLDDTAIILTAGRLEDTMDQEILNEDLEMYIQALYANDKTWFESHKMGKEEAVTFYTKELAQATLLKDNLEAVLKETNKKILEINSSFKKKLEDSGVDLDVTQVTFRNKSGIFTYTKERSVKVENEDELFTHLSELGQQEAIKTKRAVHPMTLKKIYEDHLNENGEQLKGVSTTEWSRFKVKLHKGV